MKIYIFVILTSMLLLAPFFAQAQTGPAFSCESKVYQVQSSVLRELNPLTGSYINIGGIHSSTYNATGYNTVDNYIYGIQRNGDVIRIHADGTVESLYDTGVFNNNKAGDTDDNNNLWVQRSSSLYTAVDLATGAVTDLNLTGSTLNVNDVGYLNVNGGHFLIGAENGKIMIIDLATGISEVKSVAGLPGGSYGAAWSDLNDRFWVFKNGSGEVFEINDLFGSPTATLQVIGVSSNNNDGMACRNAPFPSLGTPSIAIDKPAPTNADEDGSASITMGDTLTYSIITATNDGNVALSNVVVSDPLITPSSITCASVLPSETCVLTGTYVVTQADADAGEIINTASVVTDELTTPKTDEVTTVITQAGLLKVVKTANTSNLSNPAQVGEKITYSIVVSNAGNITLKNIVITDNNADVGSISYTVADDADNDSDIDTLAPGASATVTAEHTITLADINAAKVENQATATGKAPDDTDVTDTSDDGDDSDGNTDDDATIVDLSSMQLGVAKQAGTPTLNDDGSFDIDFTLLIENTGNVVIDNLQLSDQLNVADQLGSAYTPSTASVTTGGVITAPSLTLANTSGNSVAPSLNASFDGGSNAGLLDGNDGRLAPGDQIEVSFTVRIDPNATNAPNLLQNIATASGKDPSDNTVTDKSDNGADPEGNPGENTGTPTPITPPTTGSELGIAKQAGTPALNGDGTFDIDFTLLIENTGNVAIDNLQLSDQLNAADQLGSAYTPSVASVTTGGVITAPSLALTNTSGDSIVPNLDATFDGGSNANLLVGTDGALAPGDQIEITFSVRIDPNATNAPNPLQNIATASGKDPSDNSVTDKSDNGTDPEGNPGETTGTPTPITPPTTDAELGIAKQAGTPTLNDDGSFDIDFTLLIENTGNVVIDNLQLADQLNVADQLGSAYTPSTALVTTGGVITAPSLALTNTSGDSVAPTLDATFNGGSNDDLLAGDDGKLAPGDQIEVSFTVRVDPNATGAPSALKNLATVSGKDPSDKSVTDKSDNSTDPETNPGENTGTPTPITPPTADPELGVAKQAGTPSLNDDGTFDIAFTLVLENTGDVVLNNLQLADQLNAADQLGSAYTPSVAAVTTGGVITAPSLTLTNTSGDSVAPTLNATFDGGSNANLLIGTDGALSPDDQLTINFSVRIDPNATNAPSTLKNSATVSGQDPSDKSVTDKSDNGTDPEGNPGETTGTPTPISPPTTGSELGIAKQAGTPTLNDVGSFDIDFTLLIKNTGNVVIDNLQLSDQLNAADQLGSAFSPSTASVTTGGVITAPSLTLTNASGDSVVPSLDTAFDGGSNADLLVGTDGELAPGDQIEITFTVRIDPNASNAPSSLQNTATVSGKDPSDNSVTDKSDNGTDPEGNSGESTGTPTPITPPAITSSLEVTDVADASGLSSVTQVGDVIEYTYTVTNTGNVTITNIGVTDPNADSGSITYTSTSDADSNGSVDQLAPGESVTVTAQHTITQADIDAGLVTSQATAVGSDPAANDVSDQSDNDVDNDGNIVDDPTLTPLGSIINAQLSVVKSSAKLNVRRGEVIPYTIVIENLEAAAVTGITVVDMLPAGFKYIKNSATLDAVDVVDACAEFTVNQELRCTGVDFDAEQKRSLGLLLIAGASVSEGEYTNYAWAENAALNEVNSNTGSAVVHIAPDPVFNCTDLIGKVYDDKNYDGYQNKGEEALPNVRLATARGLLVTTDEHGRYHISCAAVPNQDRGSNFIIKVDERSLPSGYRITTENPRVVRLTRGKIEEADFGAAIHRVVRLDVDDSVYQPESSNLAVGYELHLNELLVQLVNSPSVLRIGYVSQHESKRLVKQRIKSLRKAILNKWQQQGCCYRLLIEHEITPAPLKN